METYAHYYNEHMLIACYKLKLNIKFHYSWRNQAHRSLVWMSIYEIIYIPTTAMFHDNNIFGYKAVNFSVISTLFSVTDV